MKSATCCIHAVAFALLIAHGAAEANDFELVEPGTHSIESAYSIETQRQWSAWRPWTVTTQGEYWTINGPSLEQIRFYRDIKPGQFYTLVQQARPEIKERLPRYKEDMRPHEIIRDLLLTWEVMGYRGGEMNALEPARFGSITGFRFDLTHTDADGLLYRVLGIGAVDSDSSLHLVMYRAAAEHYFDEYRDEAENIIESVSTSPRASAEANGTTDQSSGSSESYEECIAKWGKTSGNYLCANLD